MTTAMLEIRVFGELEVQLSGTKAELPPSRRARALLGWLAVHPGRHHRSRLAGLFWPDVLEVSARASLRSAIWALRSALGASFGRYLATDRDTVTLAGEDLRVDLREFRRLAAAGELAAALVYCRGDLLPELDDEWVSAAREEFERDLGAALRDLTARAAASGDQAAALGWARRRAALSPLDEPAAADLIKILIDAGDAAAALAAFAGFRQRLEAELGIGVSAATAALVAPLAMTPTAARPAPPAAEAGLVRAAGSQAADRAPPGLIGRDRQFAELTEAWRRARDSAGSMILLEGDGGIGKSRLVQELRRAAGRDPGVVSAVAVASAIGAAHAATPFGIWTDVLTDLLGARPPAGDQAWTADLARIVPAMAYLAGISPAGTGLAGAGPAGAGHPGRPAAGAPVERVQICEAVVQFLAWSARGSPLLLALEDLHLADPASLELVAYLGRRLARLPVLVVVTRRPRPARQDLEAVLAASRSCGALAAEIAVRPLRDHDVRELIAATADLPEPVVRQIVQLAAGSPLLAVETARAASGPDGSLTNGLSGAVRLAMSRLPAQGRMFVEFAAAAGRDLDRAEAAALPLPSPARAAVEALGSGLVVTGDGRTGFRHALLRDAVYAQIPDSFRARLHAELAALLRRRALQRGPNAPAGRRGARAAEIARHLRLAGQDEQAVSQLALAAQDARRVAAMAQAASFLTEAVQIEPDDPDLLVELAEVQAFRGLLADSDQAFDAALRQTSPLDSGALVGAWLRRGRWLRGGVCHPRESRRSYQNALDVLDRDPGSDPLARAEALAGLAWAEAVAGNPGEVAGLLAETDRILGGERPADLLAHDIGVARGHALIRAGRFADSFGPLIAAAAAAGRAGRPDMAYGCLSNAASASACAGDFGRALDFADRCLPLVVPNGLLRLSVYAQTARSAILRRLERMAEAGQACDTAAGYADRAGLPELAGLVQSEYGLLALARQAPDAAVVALARALDLGAPVSRPATRLRLAEALVRAGRADEAEAALREVTFEPVSPSDFPAALVAKMSLVQGLIAAARGDATLARRRLAESLAAWERIAGTMDAQQAGAGYVAALIDLGRPASSLVEPARELAAVGAELSALHDGQLVPETQE